MRLKLLLNHLPNQVLPINYYHLISNWIYATLRKSDVEYAKLLHDTGYEFENKHFKMFTFSNLEPKYYKIDVSAKSLILKESPSQITLSFYINKAMKEFASGVFKDQIFTLKSGKQFNVVMSVESIEIQDEPNFEETMSYQTNTPILVSKGSENSKHPQYLSPIDEGYQMQLKSNLLNKLAAVNELTDEIRNAPFKIELINEVKRKPRSRNNIKKIAYQYDFKMKAHPALHKIGYYAGFGENGSGLGMGMVKVNN